MSLQYWEGDLFSCLCHSMGQIGNVSRGDVFCGWPGFSSIMIATHCDDDDDDDDDAGSC